VENGFGAATLPTPASSDFNGSSQSPSLPIILKKQVWLPGFVAAHRTELPWTVAPVEFRFALTVLTAAAWVVTYQSWRTTPGTFWAHQLVGYIVAVLVNVGLLR
jgi:hypothetical protein